MRSVELAMRAAFIKNTDITDAHGWVFSRITTLAPLPTAWFLMRRRRNGSPRIFRMRRVRCRAKDLWKSERSVGVKLSAQCAKEQTGCFYSPTDLTDRHRNHSGSLSITQIAPSARQIDIDLFACGEGFIMWSEEC